MEKRKTSLLAILAFILALFSLGIGSFATWNILTEPAEKKTVVVRFWDSLYVDKLNPDFNQDWEWLIRVGGEQINNEKYVELSQVATHVNTRFHFLKSGLYRITIYMVWVSLLDTTSYFLRVHKDGDTSSLINPATAYLEDSNYLITSIFFISSDGSNFYEFSCFNSLNDPFAVSTEGQFVIEYLGNF